MTQVEHGSFSPCRHRATPSTRAARRSLTLTAWLSSNTAAQMNNSSIPSKPVFPALCLRHRKTRQHPLSRLLKLQSLIRVCTCLRTDKQTTAMFDLHRFGGGIYLQAALRLQCKGAEGSDKQSPQKVGLVDLI